MKIIAIAGATGSGKTLFSQYLSQRLPNSAVISLDHYYLDRPDTIPSEKYNFDIPNAFDFKKFNKDLETLRQGYAIQMPQYDYGIGKRKPTSARVSPVDYLIIEGLYVLMHGSIRNMLSYSFFLESPPDVLLGRRVLRDMQERSTSAEYCIYQYLHFSRPAYYTYVFPTKQYANLVVDNEYQSRLDLFLDDFLSKYHL